MTRVFTEKTHDQKETTETTDLFYHNSIIDTHVNLIGYTWAV